MTSLLASILLLAPTPAEVVPAEPFSAPGEPAPSAPAADAPTDDVVIAKTDQEEDGDYGPFFEADAPSDTTFPSQGRKGKAPALSVGNGAFCFVDGTNCKVSLLADATVAAGLRAPASNKGPDMPYAHYGFRGGLVMRPLMFKRKPWHAWGVGVVGSWSMGTGAVTVESTSEDLAKSESDSTPAVRIAMVHQLWLSQRPHAAHIDFSIGGVRSPVLTSGVPLIGTHAEVAFGWGGWASVYASGDFLDQDTRIGFGVRAHGVAAGPLIALAILGAALGGAL